MGKDLDRPIWRGQRPWFEIWFAVILDASRRRALWLRQTIFVPKAGPGRATIWGSWFDADAEVPSRGAKRYHALEQSTIDEPDALIRIGDSSLSRDGAIGSVENIAWDVRWTGGREGHADLPSWLPAPTHTQPITHDADATGRVTLGSPGATTTVEITGRAFAMHQWGKRRVPTLHWIYAPWLGNSSLEVSAISLRDSFSLGLASLRLEGPEPLTGRPATAAHPNCLITSTVAGARRLVHARAWSEPDRMVGFAYRDTDDRDLMVAQSDIGSAHFEVYARTAPGAVWRPTGERRVAGGVAVEIHQRLPLPEVSYIAWDATTSPPKIAAPTAPRADTVEWPEVRSITALGLTYGDHALETGNKLDASQPPTSLSKHVRTFAPGDGGVLVPQTATLIAALEEVELGLGAQLLERIPFAPAVMDFEGEIALVALGRIDEASLVAGQPQPFGLVAANDLTSRLCQAFGEATDRPLDYWSAAKSFERFLPVADRVWAPPGGITKLPELTLSTHVNGELRQQASSKLLIYDLAAIVRATQNYLHRPLERGDVILTGTPTGVGLRMSPITRSGATLPKDRFRKIELLVSSYAGSTELLRPGDVVEVDAGPAGRVRTRLIV